MTAKRHERTTRRLNLTTGGITLLGVFVSIGVTLGTAVSGPLWLRASVGLATTVALTVIVKAGSNAGRGPRVIGDQAPVTNTRFQKWSR